MIAIWMETIPLGRRDSKLGNNYDKLKSQKYCLHSVQKQLCIIRNQEAIL